MEFNQRGMYSNNMDRDYFVNEENSEDYVIPENKKLPRVGMKEIGVTVIDGPNAGRFSQSIQAQIRVGASRLELQPIPGGGGQGGGEVAEYGKEEREEIRQLAKINEVELTSLHVHHSTVYNLSGMGREGFSEQQRYSVVEEVKKHIDFAADALDGGSIVVHTAEFPRAISKGEHVEQHLFAGFPGEEKEATHTLVNPRTGQVINIKEDQEIWVPVQETDKKGNKRWLTDEEGKPVVDEFWKSKHKDWFNDKGELIDQSKDFLVYIPELKMDAVGNIKTEALSFETFKRKNKDKTEREQLKEFFAKQQQSEIASSLGQAREFETHYFKGSQRRTRILQALDFYTKLDKEMPEDQKWRMKRQIADQLPPDLVPPEEKNPVEYLKELLDDNTRQLAYGRETSVAGRTRARYVQDMIDSAQFLEDYAVARSAASLAEMGVYAMKQTEEKETKKDLYITPENMLPEMGWGAHPRELLKLVKDARKNMVTRLTNKMIKDPSGRFDTHGKPGMIISPDYDPDMDKSDAKEMAEKHIKATFDTSHLGMWYQHFKPEQGETEKERIKRFNGWYMDQVKMLGDSGIIGNIHVVDSFGRSHAHLAAGKGILPVVEAVEYLKSKGVTSMSSEASGDLREIMTGTWEAFGGRAYSFRGGGISGTSSAPFSSIRHSYFGHARPPSYIFGSYSPSEDWTLWSGVPFE